MAELNDLGNVRVRCPGCKGALSTYEWLVGGNPVGAVTGKSFVEHGSTFCHQYRFYSCAGCGRGGIATLRCSAPPRYPEHTKLLSFHPEANARQELPPAVPAGLEHEFREGERCMDARCWRAAAAMFRSVLDKALRASGYKVTDRTSLKQMIDLAAADGVITAARARRAHEDVRVLGNDVLHDEWRAVDAEDVSAAAGYTARLLHDLYDDRASVLLELAAAKRTPDDAAANPVAALATPGGATS